jgi:hypothetical protein
MLQWHQNIQASCVWGGGLFNNWNYYIYNGIDNNNREGDDNNREGDNALLLLGNNNERQIIMKRKR